MNTYTAENHSKAQKLSPANGEFVVRVMTYNIHSCINAKRKVNPENVADVIRDSDADIIALQEVDTGKTPGENRSQAQVLGEMLDMDYVFFPVETNGLRAFGLAVLSRFPFQDYYYDWLPNNDRKINPRRRGAVRVTLQTPVGPIYCFNTHLSLYKRERSKQLKALLDNKWLLSVPENEPVIFCGDLNSGSLSKTYRKLTQHLIDVQKSLDDPLLPRPTFHSRSPLLRLDPIFISQHFSPLTVEVKINSETRTTSDHLPLIADLAMKNTRLRG